MDGGDELVLHFNNAVRHFGARGSQEADHNGFSLGCGKPPQVVSFSTILLLSVVAFLRERVTVTLVTTLAFHVALTVWLFVIHWSSP